MPELYAPKLRLQQGTVPHHWWRRTTFTQHHHQPSNRNNRKSTCIRLSFFSGPRRTLASFPLSPAQLACSQTRPDRIELISTQGPGAAVGGHSRQISARLLETATAPHHDSLYPLRAISSSIAPFPRVRGLKVPDIVFWRLTTRLGAPGTSISVPGLAGATARLCSPSLYPEPRLSLRPSQFYLNHRLIFRALIIHLIGLSTSGSLRGGSTGVQAQRTHAACSRLAKAWLYRRMRQLSLGDRPFGKKLPEIETSA